MAKRFNIFLVVFLIFALLFSAVGSELLRRYDLTSVKKNGFKSHSVDENEIRSSLSEKVSEYNRENDRIETDSLVISEARYETEREAIRKAEEARRAEELRQQQEILRAKEEERERERLRHEALLKEQEEARLREEERKAEIARQEALLKAQEEAAIAEEERQAELARMEALLAEQEQARIEEEQRQAEIAAQEELVRQKEVEEQLEKERHEALLRQQEEERQAEALRLEEEQKRAEEVTDVTTERVEEREVTSETTEKSEVPVEETTPETTEKVESEGVEQGEAEQTERVEEGAVDNTVAESQATEVPENQTTSESEPLPSETDVSGETQSQGDSTVAETVPKTRDISLSDKVSEAHLINALDSIDSSDSIAPYAQDGKELSTLTNEDMTISYGALKNSVRDAYTKLTGDVKKNIDTAIKQAVNIRAEFITLSSLMWYVTVEDDVPLIRYAFNDDNPTELQNTTNGVFALPYTIDRDEIKLSVELFINDAWSDPYTKVITKPEIERAREKVAFGLKSLENLLVKLDRDIEVLQLPSGTI